MVQGVRNDLYSSYVISNQYLEEQLSSPKFFNQHILHSTSPTVFRLYFIHKVVSKWSLSLAGISTTGFASRLWIAQIVCESNTQVVFNIIHAPRSNRILQS